MDKKIIRLIVALLLVLVALAVYLTIRPRLLAPAVDTPSDTTEITGSTGTNSQKTSIAVTVMHKNGSTKDLTIQTEKTTLGAALLEAGLVEAEANRFGMHITSVDGEKAVITENYAYWAVFTGDSTASLATDLLPIEEGGSYKLVYAEPAPLLGTDNAAEHLFYNVYLPLANGYVGSAWDTVKAYAQHLGYTVTSSEGTYCIQSPNRSDVFFGGDLTTAGDSTEVVDAIYEVYTDGHEPARVGVQGRYADAENPANNRENPVYFVDGFVETGNILPVDTLADVVQYILDYGTLKLKTFTLVIQDTFGQPKDTFEVITSQDYMGAALDVAGFITVGQGDNGGYIERAQGVKPASGCVWQLWKGDANKDLPIDTTPVEHGGTYTIVYKRLK